MPFITYSSSHIIESNTLISNVFINEYLPHANGDCVRVYLYGQYMCNNSWRHDISLEHFSSVLNLSQDDVISAFRYWQDKGLVSVKENPFSVKYLPIRAGIMPTRNIYNEFNAQIEEIIKRPITPNEFKQYYDFMETYHVEPDALIRVAMHCSQMKGDNVGYNYILTVAKRIAFDGARTHKVVSALLEKEQAEMAEAQKRKDERAAKKASKPEKNILRHSYKDGELREKFQDTNLDEVEI